jgi:diguanylate cyclase
MSIGACSAARQPPRVLVVDDDRSMRMLCGAALGAAGFAVETAADGSSALGVLEKFQPEIILLDVDLPGMDGITLCRRLHDDPKTCEIPVCMMTGLGDLASIQRAYEAGATDFVVKPPN